MDCQDWKTVVIRGKSSPSQLKTTTQPHYQKTKEQKLLEETEANSHKSVSVFIGKTIQQARIAKGYKTQKDLAKALNVPPNIINQYECGKAIPDNAIMQKLRRILQVKL
tara:strand:- start:1006 stop:1332 length:327 start_codon:yes stop_codon:yes gene_type:complete